MPFPNTKNRARGFSLIELLVGIAIISVLIALLVPAVQYSREAARRTQCKNNLRQMGLALMNYESNHGVLPPSRIDVSVFPGPVIYQTSWMTMCLPYLDQTPVYNRYNFQRTWNDPSNLPATSTTLTVFLCPSAPSGRRTPGPTILNEGQPWPAGGLGLCDYGSMNAIRPSFYLSNGLPTPQLGLATNTGSPPSETKYEWNSGLRKNAATRLAEITDGLSSTLLAVEIAARPQLYLANMSPAVYGDPTVKDGWGWADIHGGCSLDGSNADGTKTGKARCKMPDGPCTLTTKRTPFPINKMNDSEIYAFHVGGCHVLLCDGSVRFVGENISAKTMAALTTRNADDSVGEF